MRSGNPLPRPLVITLLLALCQHFLECRDKRFIKPRLIHEARCAHCACYSASLGVGRKTHDHNRTLARGDQFRPSSRIGISPRHSNVNQ
jgi:hypothetical protein